MSAVVNSLGRALPATLNGLEVSAYQGAFAPIDVSRPAPMSFAPTPGMGRSKVRARLAEVVEMALPQGGTVSLPHYYRDDAAALIALLDALRFTGRRGIRLFGMAFFNSHAEPIRAALRDGTLAGIEGNVYGAAAKLVGSGELGEVVVGRSHGGRARALELGQRMVDLALVPVPIADRFGNANGVEGPYDAQVGPIALSTADARFARHTAVLAAELHPGLLAYHPIDMASVDSVIIGNPGSNKGIGTGTTDVSRMRQDPIRLTIAELTLRVLRTSGVIRPGFNFQIGSGSGLLVLDEVLKEMGEKKIRGGFTVGGTTESHVDLLEQGLIEVLLDGQCFQPSARSFRSLRENPQHIEVSTSLYYSPVAKQEGSGLMDAVVLGASEVDRDFNLNTVTGYDGVLRTGIGGGPDAAAGAGLTVIALPLARGNKNGTSAPSLRDRVTTVVTPGEVVDVIVTEAGVAINPASRSPWVERLREDAAAAGLRLSPMEALVEASEAAARALGPVMEKPRTTDQIVYAVEWRDGRLLDVVRKLE